ncbi:CAP domain-containing protein [Aurantibacter crassamenti]|uniref:CAP domain-containing protein n=1 Tax=Aurantibacter crassamenti TaxID=1837375 RepID=UPI0019396360|nr:CAP domain-containing protein [Aurantibacter crassamenti]MBM1104937.1 CAP domain-containing protein [Aurantibacter crassamenti]
MKMRLQHLMLVLFVCLGSSCSKESLENTNSSDLPIAKNNIVVEEELLDVVNNHRLSIGVNTLEFSEEAYVEANAHNDYMISKGNLSHDNFSSRASKIAAVIDVEYVAENVAKNFDTAAGAYENWLGSASHKKTMEGEFTHTAVSVKSDASGKLYFTQLFFR